jgi:hypothetical protein
MTKVERTNLEVAIIIDPSSNRDGALLQRPLK